MKNIAFVLFLALGLLNAQEITWMSVEDAEKVQLENPSKSMFIDVYTDWCGWCKKMDNSTFKDKEVVEFLSKYFIPVKLNAEQKKDIKFKNQTFKYISSGNSGIHHLAYALLQGELSYPSYVVLNSKGEITHMIRGFMNPNDLLNQL